MSPQYMCASSSFRRIPHNTVDMGAIKGLAWHPSTLVCESFMPVQLCIPGEFKEAPRFVTLESRREISQKLDSETPTNRKITNKSWPGIFAWSYYPLEDSANSLLHVASEL